MSRVSVALTCIVIAVHCAQTNQQWQEEETEHVLTNFRTRVNCSRNQSDGQVICDCLNSPKPMTLPLLPNYSEHFRIRNCRDLHIPSNVFEQSRIVRSVILEDIASVSLDRWAFQFQQNTQALGIRLEFRRVHLSALASHSLKGHLEQIIIDHCIIDDIDAFAISPSEDMLSIAIQHSRIGQINRHALKKFSVGQLTISNTTFVHTIPSAVVYDLTVTERLRIADSEFAEIFPNAFQFEDVRTFELIDNRIATLNGSSFQMTIAERVNVIGNNFTELSGTAFLAISSKYVTQPQAKLQFQPPEFTFSDNRIANVHPLDLNLRINTEAFHLSMQRINFRTVISCSQLSEHSLRDASFYQLHGDSLLFRTCDDCEPMSYDHHTTRQCRADQTIVYIASGVSIMAILLVVTVLVVWWLYRRRQEALQRLTVVQPEARTYRETQIVIQIENAGLLKTDI